MSNLNFIKRLYNGKNCYSDHMSADEINLIHISSKIEAIAIALLKANKIVFLTGNPGDGKTFIIKSIQQGYKDLDAYIETDLNNVEDYGEIVEKLFDCYKNGKAAVVAANEYPFVQLCKSIEKRYPDFYNEIKNVKNSIITYDTSSCTINKVAVIDLNERNMLAADSNLISGLLDNIISLLSEEEIHNTVFESNIKALKDNSIKSQLLEIFELTAAENEHFAIRDILGAIAFVITACLNEETENMPYYNAIFEGNNKLLNSIKQFDPIYLTDPNIDEQLWNGAIETGWIVKKPDVFPCNSAFENDVDGAVDCFKTIKRQYYFENTDGMSLKAFQPEEIKDTVDIFRLFESQKKKIKEKIIKSINKLFLPSMSEKKVLFIWSTLKYDMSQEASVAVSSKSIDAGDLEIKMPRPTEWISGMEYVPNHIVLKPKQGDTPTLMLDMDFLRTLEAIESGYPIGLLAPQYEQAASRFLQQLDEQNYTEENDDDEIIIACRNKNYIKKIVIEDNHYIFEEN